MTIAANSKHHLVGGALPRSSSPAESLMTAVGIINIANDGDIVLNLEHEVTGTKQARRFRCSSATLRSTSRYFANLLGGRFGESERVEKEQRLLRQQHGTMADVVSSELPGVHIEDLGRISAVKSIEGLCSDFLNMLHNHDIPLASLANLANLAIVADRFDALAAVQTFMRRKKMVRAIDGRTTPKADSALTEEKVRQRVLVAALLDYGPWLEKYSLRLITKGWVGGGSIESAALWWDLPSRLEEELAFRRECVLDTIQSLQSYLLRLYTSRERQCRLGYDSSPQCDSFQLGEMIRFFSRTGTLRMQGTILDITTEPKTPYDGDIYSLIDSLRQISEHQVDRNHSHCGARVRMIPLLDFLADSLAHVGVCAECWSNDRLGHSWIEAKRPLVWKRPLRSANRGHKESHAIIRAVFTASERDWA